LTMAYGIGLRIEGHDCGNAAILRDEEAVQELLVTAIQVADMTLLAGPFCTEELTRDIGKGPGLTACAILYESHVVIHTYPEQRWFLFEMTTCKEFDSVRVVNLLRAWADCKTVTDCTVVGHMFPEPVEANG